MQKLNYMNYINANPNALKTLQLLLTLPLLAVRDIERGFRLIAAFSRNHGVHMEILLNYYEL